MNNLNELICSTQFNDAVNFFVDVKLDYYDKLKKYIFKGCKEKTQQSLEDGIEHIYRCMLLDEYVPCNNTSIVYFIRNQYNGLLKIGKTNNLARRLREIEKSFTFLGMDTQKLSVEAISYCPFNMDNSQVESYYHDLYKENRILGEWFDISYDQLWNDMDIVTVSNGIIVSIEDPIIFPKNVKCANLIEIDINKLKSKISRELIDLYKKSEGNFDILNLLSEKQIFAQDIWEYILTLEKDEDLLLDKKIFKKIEGIIESVKNLAAA